MLAFFCPTILGFILCYTALGGNQRLYSLIIRNKSSLFKREIIITMYRNLSFMCRVFGRNPARFVKTSFVLLATIAVLMIGASEARAYSTYSTDGSTGNCASCHGDFTKGSYISLSDGENWGDDLHDVHRRTMLNSDCNACHVSSGGSPTFLDRSAGGTGLAPISCVGCHGRDDDIGNDSESTGRGAGLRQAVMTAQQ